MSSSSASHWPGPAPGPGASPNRIRYVSRFDNARFYELYIDLMTRPVPVTLPPY